MARGRKSSHVKVLTGKDQELIRGLGQVGVSTSEQLKTYLNLNTDRLAKLEVSGYIKRENVIVRGRAKAVYTLDDGGKKFCKEQLGLQHLYKWNSRQLPHDLKLAEAYYSFPLDVRHTWRNETDLLNQFSSGSGTVPVLVDATVQVGNEIIAIEAIGSGYTKEMINAKIEFANTHFDGIKTF
jgi:hypothetical protein